LVWLSYLVIFGTLTGETLHMEDNMDIFDTEDLELNLDVNTDDLEENEEEENTDTPDGDKSPEEDTDNKDKPSEDQDDSEEVASDKDLEEGGDENDSPNLYSSLASVLHEQGLLPSLNLEDNKINDVEGISSAFKSEIENNVKQRLIDALGEDGYEAVTNGVSLSDFGKSRENQITLDSIDADSFQEDSDLAQKVIYQDYLNQGISEDKAKRLLKRAVDSGDDALIEDATESLESLKLYEKNQLAKRQDEYKQTQLSQQKQQEELDTKLKDKIYNSSELMDGMKLNKAIKDKIYGSMTDIVGKNEQGVLENKLMRERRENPVEFDTKLYYLYELTNGFKNFKNISNVARTSASSELEKAIRQTSHNDSGSPSFMDDNDSYSGLGDEIVY